MYLTPNELRQAKEIQLSLNENSLTYNIAEALLGNYAMPESIFLLSENIKNYSLNEDADEEGSSLIRSAFGCDTKTANSFLQDSKRAGICLRALRDKYEEISWQASRDKAEKRGFWATVLWTIKKAMSWILRTFQDLKDDFFDLIKDRPENFSKGKRDYEWLKSRDYITS